jgi:hypothetical protein
MRPGLLVRVHGVEQLSTVGACWQLCEGEAKERQLIHRSADCSVSCAISEALLSYTATMSAGSHEIMELQRELNELKNKIAVAEQEGDKKTVRALLRLRTALQEKQNLLLKAKQDGTGDASQYTQCTSVRAPLRRASIVSLPHVLSVSIFLCAAYSEKEISCKYGRR